MIKDIKYSGLSTAPSDYECADGALAASLNLVSEEQHLAPVFQPKVKMVLVEGEKVVGIHSTAQYNHYMIFNTKTHELSWMEDNMQGREYIGTFHYFSGIEFVGNTLIVLSENELMYILWQDNKYRPLGSHLPSIDLSFGLKGNPRFYSISGEEKKSFVINFDGINEAHIYDKWTENNKKRITEQVMAKVNKFLYDQTVRKGKFALPFFVRYALRLYDDSLVCHSAPILMNPSTFAAPVVLWDRIKGKNHTYSSAECDIMLVTSSLDCQIVADGYGEIAQLKANWSDIIKSVDIFISAPIYTYDQSGECSSFDDTDNFKTKFIGALNPAGVFTYVDAPREDHIIAPLKVNSFVDSNALPYLKSRYAEWTYDMLYALYKDKERKYPTTVINMPEYSIYKVRENIENVSNFYLLHSIKFEELKTNVRKDIVVNDEYLQSLQAREVMSDDYLTHDRLIAKFAHGYNSRLNLAGVSRELFRGFSASSMLAYCNVNTVEWSVSDDGNRVANVVFPEGGAFGLSAEVYIKENGQTHLVHCEDQMRLSRILSANRGTGRYRSWGNFVYYPNRNAFKMVINDSFGTFSYDLKPHDFLNGAYCFADFEQLRITHSDRPLPDVPSSDNRIGLQEKLYTSEVNNPFLFLASGINTVGTGKILGISSATKALSQGQFGQFPLYAFTDEGVWALEVSSTGTYSAKQPVTRDVCINPESITQLDSAVLFTTARGIMMISGAETACISESIDSSVPFNVLSLPGMDRLHQLAGHTGCSCFPTVPFLDFLAGCSMIYDYIHQHIIVFNKKYTYAYVYSLKSREWGMTYSEITSGIKSYPDAMVMATGNRLVSFSETDELISTGIFVTRPLKIDMADILKTVDTLIQRGMFRKGDVNTVLWGSRDLFNWHIIGSSVDNFLRNIHGTSYKYFRIGGITKLSAEQSLFGATIQFTPKQNNKPR